MPDVFDFSVDELADAPLTPGQRRIWNAMRTRNQELTEKLRHYEQEKDQSQSAVLNRDDFNREVARMLAFDERYGGISSILYLDFEGIDEKGVDIDTLRAIAAALSRGVRSSDIIGRLAPSEFGILLMRCDNANAWRKGETLSIALRQKLAEIGRSDTKISYGAYTFRDNEDLSTGLKEAAQALTQKGNNSERTTF
ncbi:MAG: diguanylate cyclase [Alphaproteobacteria bacterium]|nr:diguanylate cyclase [Alphaproteobacteria bacterium]